MEHRGVRYLILVRIERDQGSVKIYPGTADPLERLIKGTRKDAVKQAEFMIDQMAPEALAKIQIEDALARSGHS
jgi:hypothetical protein